MRKKISQLREHRTRAGEHPGLILQRYAFRSPVGEDGQEEREQLLSAACNAACRPELRELYKKAFERWKNVVQRLGAKTCELRCDGRLIVGLGSENILEAGLTLHHTYGIPVIPGSALKGTAASYCHHVWGARDGCFREPSEKAEKQYLKYLEGRSDLPEEGKYYRILFGSTNDRGCITFYDAWYVPESASAPLERDVMTPHHMDFNRDVDDPKFAAPSDFDSPNPVTFLSVTGKFLFAVRWSGPPCGEAGRWTELALELLRRTLADHGVGGKTRSGYGQFTTA